MVKHANRADGLVGAEAVSGEVTFEQRPERAEKGCFRHRLSTCKGPEVGGFWLV